MSETEILDRRAELVQRIWETLHQPWLLRTVGGALLLLYLFAIFLQQMPGPLYDDPAGAERWTRITSENYGLLGDVFSSLGLFNVIHNPLLQLLLVLLALIVLIHLGDTIAQAWRLYQMPQRIEEPTATVGDPLPVPTTQSTFRLRQAVATEGATLAQMFQAKLLQRFDTVERSTVTVDHKQTPKSDEQKVEAAADEDPDEAASRAAAEAQPINERRFLALRAVRYALLRPILFLGLLVALITVWIMLIWGWTLTPTPLTPGGDYRSAAQRLVLQYEVESTTTTLAESDTGASSSAGASPIAATKTISTTESNRAATTPAVPRGTVPVLVASIGEESRRAPLGSTIRLNHGQTVIMSHAGPPALFLRTTSEEPLLSPFGQSQLMPTMGLIFPSPGSEESVVVAQALGLRIVRLPTQATDQTEQFLVEVYDANNALIKRIPISESSATDLIIDKKAITVEFVLLPSMQVEVTHQPAIWLFWPAALLLMIGLVGYAYKPAFVVVQLAPWPMERIVVVVQSDDEQEVSLVEHWLQHDQNEGIQG